MDGHTPEPLQPANQSCEAAGTLETPVIDIEIPVTLELLQTLKPPEPSKRDEQSQDNLSAAGSASMSTRQGSAGISPATGPATKQIREKGEGSWTQEKFLAKHIRMMLAEARRHSAESGMRLELHHTFLLQYIKWRPEMKFVLQDARQIVTAGPKRLCKAGPFCLFSGKRTTLDGSYRVSIHLGGNRRPQWHVACFEAMVDLPSLIPDHFALQTGSKTPSGQRINLVEVDEYIESEIAAFKDADRFWDEYHTSPDPASVTPFGLPTLIDYSTGWGRACKLVDVILHPSGCKLDDVVTRIEMLSSVFPEIMKMRSQREEEGSQAD
ncbi:hypothetical protein ACJZ2D_006542 [Fusarium nematophilum]